MLREIELHDFKSFNRASLQFGAVTLIVGANAAGKSNLRDALRVLHGIGLGYSLPEVLGGKYGPGGIQQWRGIRGGAREVVFHDGKELTVSAVVKSGKAIFRYALTVDVSDEALGPRVTQEYLESILSDASAEMKESFDRPKLFYSVPPGDPKERSGPHEIKVREGRLGSGPHPRDRKLPAFPSHTPVLSQLPRRGRERADLRRACERVLEVFQGMRFLDLDPDAMRESSPAGQMILGDRGENLSSVLQAISQDAQRKEQLLGWLRSLTPMDAVDFDFRRDLQGRVLVYLVEKNRQTTSAVSASDGTLRFLALVAALLSPDSGQLYFFEEFDNGIHPTRLHLLLNLVQQACREEGIQVVGTTHNPALLAFLDKDARQRAVLAYRPEGAGDSRLRRIMTLPDMTRILKRQDLGRLHASGWLEDAAVFSEPDEDAK